MKNVFFPMHLGSGNRGCEGIIRGTKEILDFSNCKLIMYDKNPREIALDKELGLVELGEFESYNEDCQGRDIFAFIKKVISFLGGRIRIFGLLPYKHLLKNVDKESVVFFTGGDLYCYARYSKVNTWLNEELHKRGVKTVLWGASVSKEFLSENTIRGLKKFSCITCRESLSYKNLKEIGVNRNLYLFPDSAFVLKADPISLPECFEGTDVVGINISNFVNGSYGLDSLFGENIISLIKYILNNSQSNILIIPHVTWEKQDDRIISDNLYQKFRDTGRVFILDIKNMKYTNIRYIISKCRFFVGARTHAIISAYSMGIPALALGYSIKSRGIAHDLRLDPDLVVDCRRLSNKDEILDHYKKLEKNENAIRVGLKEVLPQYIKKAYDAKQAVKDIL